jgi:hypothetical protein
MSSIPVPEKACTRCGQTFPATLEHFGVARREKYGLNARCRACRKADIAACAEANRARVAAWEAANPDKVRAQRAKRAAKHKVYAQRWYQTHRAEVIANVAAWAKANHDHVRTIAARRRAEFPELHRTRNRLRHRRARAAPGTHNAQDILAQYEAQGGCCYWCGKPVGASYHVDHVIPLTRGGSNGPENLVISCPTCNLRKGNKLPGEWHPPS